MHTVNVSLLLLGRHILTVALMLIAGNALADTLIEAGKGTSWKYSAAGETPGSGWQQMDFDDSRWDSGAAPLGFGDPGLSTELTWAGDAKNKPMTTWFRHTFEVPALKPDDRLALMIEVDDGAIFYLNGKRLGLINMPAENITSETPALQALSDEDEGFYHRFMIPASAFKTRLNTLAVEVHQCNPASTDLWFNLALKTTPETVAMETVPSIVETAVTAYWRQHYVGPETPIPDGYFDGGRRMTRNSSGLPSSDREIIVLDRTLDNELAADLAFARGQELQKLEPMERALRLAIHIDKRTTPAGGTKWIEKLDSDFSRALRDRTVLLGDWIEQSNCGVCRHRALLFKVLADEAGLKTALVRGNYSKQSDEGPFSPHVWNELHLEDGRRLLADVMINRAKPNFPDVNSPEVVAHYYTVDNTPWYSADKP